MSEKHMKKHTNTDINKWILGRSWVRAPLKAPIVSLSKPFTLIDGYWLIPGTDFSVIYNRA